MTPAGAKVIGYCRVSTEEQGRDGASLDAQERAIREYAEGRGWDVKIIREIASGRSMSRRPGIREALAALRSGEASALIVTKLDRLSRSVPDAFQVLNTSGKQKWDLVIMDMGLDTTTAMGKAMYGFAAVFAQLYRDQISENTKAGLAEKRRQGVRLGRPRALDQWNRRDERNRMAVALARIRYLRREGESLRAIADDLNYLGHTGPQGGKWTHATVSKAIQRYGMEDDK